MNYHEQYTLTREQIDKISETGTVLPPMLLGILVERDPNGPWTQIVSALAEKEQQGFKGTVVFDDEQVCVLWERADVPETKEG